MSVTADDLKDGAYEVKVASWDQEQRRIKNLSASATVNIDASAQGLTETGSLLWTMQVWGTCDECRNMTMKGSVKFYDASGNEIEGSGWSDLIDSDYDTFAQEHSLGGSGIVPKGAVKAEVVVSNHVGTKSDLELTSTFALTTTSNLEPESFENSYIATIKGSDFYERSDAVSGSDQSKTFYFDYLKNDTVYASDVDFFATIYLDTDAQAIANEGYLTYAATFFSKCGECRTMQNDAIVRCYDASGKELLSGQWNVSEDDYDTFPQSKEFRSGEVCIPEGTSYLKLQCSNEVGTNSHLGLYGMLVITSLKNADYWSDNTVVDSTDKEVTTISVHESYSANGATGEGALLHFTDVFKDLDKRVSASDREALFRSALLNQNVLFNWSQLAYDVFKTENAYWDHAEVGFGEAFGNNHYADLMYQFTHQTDGLTDESASNMSAWGSSSGLRQASTWDDVLEDATGNLALQRKKLSSRMFGKVTAWDFLNHHDVGAVLALRQGDNAPAIDDYDGLIYYTYVNTTDQRGAEQFYYYNSFILAFYDFEFVSVVEPTSYVIKPVTNTLPSVVSQSTLNDTAATSSITAEHSYSESSTASNQITASSAVDASATVGLNVSGSVKFGTDGTGIEGGFAATSAWTTGEAFSFSESTAQSDTTTENFGSSSTTPLPAYTMGVVTTTDTVSVLEQHYDCPLAIQYKVMIIGLNGKYYDDGVGVLDLGSHEHNTFAVSLGYDIEALGAVTSVGAATVLREDFESTGLEESAIASCPLPASALYADDENLKEGRELLAYLGTHMPITYEDAAYSDRSSHTEYETKVYASRPLNYTAVTKVATNFLNEKNQIVVKPGQAYNLTNNISIGGFNAAGGEYFDFVESQGYYALYDSEGQPLSGNVAYLEKNAVNGNTYLIVPEGYASSTDTLFHVVYHINDGVYSYVNSASQEYGQNGYTTDKSLTKRATVDVVLYATSSAGSSDGSAAADGSSASDSSAATDGSSDDTSGDGSSTADDSSESAEAPESSEPSAVSSPMNSAFLAALSETGYTLATLTDCMSAAWGITAASVENFNFDQSINEQQLCVTLYAAWCFLTESQPESNFWMDADGFRAEAVAWVQNHGLQDLHSQGIDTYREAVRYIDDYAASHRVEA